jgi:hypothetical protein
MPPQGGIRCGEAAFIKALRAARPRPAAGWHMVNFGNDYNRDWVYALLEQPQNTQEKTPGNAPGVFLAWFISQD